MTTLNLFISGVLAIFLLLMFGALVELHRQVAQLRQSAGLVDRVRPVDFHEAASLSSLPIPGVERAEGSTRSVILILSESCITCAEIASDIGPKEPGRLITLVEGRSAASATAWMSQVGLQHSATVIYDEHGHIAQALGVTVTPAAVKFEGPAPLEATTVPSSRQLAKLRDWLHRLDEPFTELTER
jgi:hypothetical protein